jgi:hypothetical protein
MAEESADIALAGSDGSDNNVIIDAQSSSSQPVHNALRNATLRKRGRSVGDSADIVSPETVKQLTETRKRNKKAIENSFSIQNDQKMKQTMLNEQCLYCNKTGTTSNMLQCETCEQFYHLACCNILPDDNEMVLKCVFLLYCLPK